MKRVIKFRAWDKAYKRMCSPDGSTKNLSGWLGAPEIFEVMQYTGLKDKNGVEIYEGDVVEYEPVRNHHRRCHIIYESGAAAFLLYDRSKGSINYVQIKYLGDIVREKHNATTRTHELCEVVGNIYENPELTEQAA